VVREQRKAETAESLRKQLEGQGFFIFEIAPDGAGTATSRSQANLKLDLKAPFAFRGVGPKELLIFNQELLALVRAGLPIPLALDLLAQRAQHAKLRQVLSAVRDDVREGSALSAALGKHRDVFPGILVASVRAGEQSGTLPDALSRYVVVLKQIVALRRRVMNALMYPFVLLLLSVAVVIFLITYVVPRFSSIYQDLGRSIPVPTQVLLGITAAIHENWLFLLAGIAAAAAAAWTWGRSDAGLQVRDRLLLAVPWAGEVIRRYALTQFCRTLAMVLGGGIPMMQALPVAIGAIENRYIRRQMQRLAPTVATGTPLATALEESGTSPGLAVEMLAVGEQTGSLENMLGNVADFFGEEVETRLASMAALIEPIIMVGMGLLVATILIVMYLPVFQIYGDTPR
jgi:type IV pilus assembly protein PilC